MTYHRIRPFADAAAVRRVGTGLLDTTLPREDWTHEAHLAACLWLLAERPEVHPERELPGIIRRFNEAKGGVNDDTQGYHETLTQLYIKAVREFLADRPAGDLAGSLNALLAGPLGDRAWPLTLYSRERLFSVTARREWVEPDQPRAEAM